MWMKERQRSIGKLAKQRKWSKSQVIREAIGFFDEYNFGNEVAEKIQKLSKLTKLRNRLS